MHRGPRTALGPWLDLSEALIVPAVGVDIRVQGLAGAHYALAASPTNTGLVVRGIPFALGSDAWVLATGQLDANGRAVVSVAPEFSAGPTLYIQAVTAPTGAFETLATTPGKVVRDLRAWLPGASLGLSTAANPCSSSSASPLLVTCAARARPAGRCLRHGHLTSPD